MAVAGQVAMKGRPEVLYPLFGDLQSLPGVGPKLEKALVEIALTTPKDLIYTLPYSGVVRNLVDQLRPEILPAVVTLRISVSSHARPVRKGRPYRILASGGGQQLQLVFFHARPQYLENLLPVDAERIISGKAELFDGMVQIVHPDYVVRPDEGDEIPAFEPIYHASAAVSQKALRKSVVHAVKRAPDLREWIDPGLLKQRKWPAWSDAINAVHSPTCAEHLSFTHAPRERLAYDELFAHQLTLAIARSTRRRRRGVCSKGDGALRKKVFAQLPYQPTGAQKRAIVDIEADMASVHRMNRLLQGDVGAGKTLVAFMALLIAVEAGGQGVLMAPTEVLARQHADVLGPLAAAAGVRLQTLTGRDKGKVRRDILERLATGQIDILVGTHAVFQDDVRFGDLRLAVVDEQHRFGVGQRLKLGEKGAFVDVMVMTATPIPRSLALAQYGDMDVSVLDEKPAGRRPVKTALISQDRLDEVVNHLSVAIKKGKQAFWVCPLVEDSEVSDLSSATERYEALCAQFGAEKVGLVHGQLGPAEKDAAMRAFQNAQTSILVATTVIEVGVDIPNATIMVIERAEHFGLAQLHQLRGRVGRGQEDSTCLLLYRAPLNENARERLVTIRESEDGFRIAEVDLSIRGAGDLIGTAQSGLPRFRVADLERQPDLMAVAQKDARNLLVSDPGLTSERGQAARTLLWLMEQNKAIELLHVG